MSTLVGKPYYYYYYHIYQFGTGGHTQKARPALVSRCQTAFFFYIGMGKKGLVNGLYHFCSTDPQFLRVVNWSLIGVNQE